MGRLRIGWVVLLSLTAAGAQAGIEPAELPCIFRTPGSPVQAGVFQPALGAGVTVPLETSLALSLQANTSTTGIVGLLREAYLTREGNVLSLAHEKLRLRLSGLAEQGSRQRVPTTQSWYAANAFATQSLSLLRLQIHQYNEKALLFIDATPNSPTAIAAAEPLNDELHSLLKSYEHSFESMDLLQVAQGEPQGESEHQVIRLGLSFGRTWAQLGGFARRDAGGAPDGDYAGDLDVVASSLGFSAVLERSHSQMAFATTVPYYGVEGTRELSTVSASGVGDVSMLFSLSHSTTTASGGKHAESPDTERFRLIGGMVDITMPIGSNDDLISTGNWTALAGLSLRLRWGEIDEVHGILAGSLGYRVSEGSGTNSWEGRLAYVHRLHRAKAWLVEGDLLWVKEDSNSDSLSGGGGYDAGTLQARVLRRLGSSRHHFYVGASYGLGEDNVQEGVAITSGVEFGFLPRH